MPLPEFLLVDDSYADVQTFIALVKRIGIANVVRPVPTVDDATRYLTCCAPSGLPVVVFAAAATGGLHIHEDLLSWMDGQGPPISAIPALAVEKPLEMYQLMAAVKTLALPERARIDTTTLMVRVELWPHGTVFRDA